MVQRESKHYYILACTIHAQTSHGGSKISKGTLSESSTVTKPHSQEHFQKFEVFYKYYKCFFCLGYKSILDNFIGICYFKALKGIVLCSKPLPKGYPRNVNKTQISLPYNLAVCKARGQELFVLSIVRLLRETGTMCGRKTTSERRGKKHNTLLNIVKSIVRELPLPLLDTAASYTHAYIVVEE